jgi:vesicle coat complex subunit
MADAVFTKATAAANGQTTKTSHSTTGRARSSTTSSSSPPPRPPTYFSEFKKGEVNELYIALQESSLERDMDKQREVVKKVIAYMTIGIDVSRLFPEMIMVWDFLFSLWSGSMISQQFEHCQ